MIIPSNKRCIESTISTTSPSQWKGKNYEYNFKIERKISGLCPVWINKMQHSGTHFLATRFSCMGYAECELQRANNPWIDKNLISEFVKGGRISLTELEPNTLIYTFFQGC